MKKRPYAFTLYEAVLTLALVGLVLGMVAEGYQRLSTLNSISVAASKRTEILAQMHNLCAQIGNCYGYTIVSPNQLKLDVVDPADAPSLDLTYFENGRLPWPLPSGPPLSVPYPIQRSPYLITITFLWQPGTSGNPGSILKNTAPVSPNRTVASSTPFLCGLSNFQVTADACRQLIHVELTPSDSNNSLNVTAYMPLVP